ncbi:N-6 DNA methylase [Serratia marcescens]|uniref:N-6 DNA methylase n=1 Tax=Serratia marcescens TaxID=615 RepID=UPI001F156AFB|nr:N-6 DNA methylase [Serratia marcescens]
MIQLNNHNEHLKSQFESALGSSTPEMCKESISLDFIDLVLRQCLNIEEMREAGSFFTGQQLATIVVNKLKDSISFDSVILDPTCGAGNLLIECSRKLDVVEQSLKETLKKWGVVLRGYDIHNSFVEAAKLRLITEALNRGVEKDCSLVDALQLFPYIRAADVMSIEESELKKATHIVMNPPFSIWTSPKIRFWKSGKVNAAGIVFEHILRRLPVDCQVSAILPDVLRSGSRYENWRDFASGVIDGNCEIYGRFNKKTDVDVFILSGKVSSGHNKIVQWQTTDDKNKGAILSDLFDVCVGSLVAYRDPVIGNSYPYIHPKSAPAWGVMKEFTEYRKYSGKVFSPPLIVIRRTSSPSDKFRAVGTLIQGKGLVAIENHMIVLQPKNGTVKTCKKLMRILKSKKINDYLNERIRLRHLTVGVVKKLPLK